MATPAVAPKVVVTLEKYTDHKKTVRYTSDNEALTSVYVGKAALEKLGNPDVVKVTITAT